MNRYREINLTFELDSWREFQNVETLSISCSSSMEVKQSITLPPVMIL